MTKPEQEPASPSDDGTPRRPGLHLPPGADALVHATSSLVAWLAHAGEAGARAVVPEAVVSPVEQWVTAMRQFAEGAPTVGEELRILTQEIHAKRLTIQAMTAELTVLDAQLEVLERVLAPVEAWSEQLDALRNALLRDTEQSPPDPR